MLILMSGANEKVNDQLLVRRMLKIRDQGGSALVLSCE